MVRKGYRVGRFGRSHGDVGLGSSELVAGGYGNVGELGAGELGADDLVAADLVVGELVVGEHVVGELFAAAGDLEIGHFDCLGCSDCQP